MTVFPINPVSLKGFKCSKNEIPCKNEYGGKFIQCIEERAFTTEEIFPKTRKHYEVKQFYSDYIYGLVQSVDIRPGVISKKQTKTLAIKMNRNMSYHIQFHDSNLKFYKAIPDTLPRSTLHLNEHAGAFMLFLQATIF